MNAKTKECRFQWKTPIYFEEWKNTFLLTYINFKDKQERSKIHRHLLWETVFD